MPAEIKPIYGTEREHLADKVPLSAPYSAFVFPTTYCNFKCAYCAHSLGLAEMKKQYGFSPEHMSMDTYRKTVAQFQEFPAPLKLLSLTGQGEPLLSPHIAEMVAIAKQAHIAERIEIITNGALLRPQLSDALIKAGLSVLRVSLQGLRAQKYEQLCHAKIDFEEFYSNLRYFYEHRGKAKLFLKVIDVALDAGEEEKFYEMFSPIADRIFIEHMLPTYDGVEMTDGMQITQDRYGGKTTEMHDVCPLAFYMLGVFPNGDVEPCDTLYKPVVLGNVHTSTLKEMWHGKILHDFWRLQLSGRCKDNAQCARCCAPNDVAHPEDVLDGDAAKILARVEALS